ncbi:RDD family protein [Nesterenkonia sp. NBAIMH1]|uniref:RDD family protein n=1 Tax=Nesterenkonia sp. NBAIMH1 TaxID=2600320 RepID=UPI00143CD762|nr:RDD family protein [Nesterenkonia sp. NBAIMH1]
MAQAGDGSSRERPQIELPGLGSAEPADVIVRFWARVVDAVLLCVLLMAAAVFAWGLASGAGMESIVWQVGIVMLFAVLYEPGMTAWKGATPGKLIAGIRVVDVRTGRWPRIGSSLLRYGVLFALSLMYLPGSWSLLGLLALIVLAMVIGTHPQRRGWHDRAGRTAVVLADTLDRT